MLECGEASLAAVVCSSASAERAARLLGSFGARSLLGALALNHSISPKIEASCALCDQTAF